MSEKLTDEQVEEILEGCEGVTPGPWFDENPGDDVTLGWVNDSDPLNDGGSLATTWAAGRPVGEGKINAAHIARLDPQTVSSLATELLALRKRVGELEGALTPTAETKAAYIGEFTIAVERIVNEDDEPVDDGADAPDPYDHIQVPWTTIKQIMAAIRAFALHAPKEPS